MLPETCYSDFNLWKQQHCRTNTHRIIRRGELCYKDDLFTQNKFCATRIYYLYALGAGGVWFVSLLPPPWLPPLNVERILEKTNKFFFASLSLNTF